MKIQLAASLHALKVTADKSLDPVTSTGLIFDALRDDALIMDHWLNVSKLPPIPLR